MPGHSAGDRAMRPTVIGLLRIVLLVFVLPLGGRQLGAQQSPLDQLVAEGLARNLGLRQERLSLERASAGVREARGRWLPSLNLNARYSERSGDILDLGD